MGSVAPLATATRPLIAKKTAASCLPAPQTTASAHNARLINGGTMGAASTSTGTMSFAAATITPELVNATTTTTPAMPTPVMAAAESEHLPLAPGVSERANRRLLPRLLQDHDNHPAVQLAQHSKAQRPQRTGRAHDHGRSPVHAKRSCITEVSSEENSGQRGVFISTVRQARSSAATHRTVGCSANTSTCSSCGLLGPVHMGTVSHIWRQLRGTLNLLIT